MPGTPWSEQELGEPLVDVIEKFRSGVRNSLVGNGRFDVRDTDHNSPNYSGLSNKQISIAAVVLDPACKDKPYEDKVRVMVKAAFGA